ncbi:uncharacterized protein LOC132903263 [Amyelois transitella]|uniref:uncharacterized protein LOC132903263 n=1 Tax=Amyelois transitella TaxID=680683 RepID=UPI00298FEC3B|nr:uncharacterized protein LOC132903263 [Amyelois transitella]
MEEDEYDDELPPIVVNSSSRDESVFAMPSAEVLASQRARAEECERELQQLRAQHDLQEMELEAGSAENTPPTVPSRSDSSGSEGETALASAVEALRVGGAAAGAAAAESRPALGAVLARVLQQLPDTARALCAAYSDALTAGRDVDVLTDELLTGVGSWLGGLAGEEGGPLSESPTDDEVVGVGAWLSALALGAPAPRARRALHALLAAAADRQVHKLACVLVPALEEARWRLDLVTALQAAGRPQLALTLCQCALTQLLQPDRHAAMQASACLL